ncbi:MAG TPA: hypothetical protein VF037_06145, partial [Gemmatimonadales bacterium]
MGRRRSLLPLSLLVAGALACATDAEPNVMTVTARDFAFEAPDTVAAGLTTIRLQNQGPEFHHVQLIRLEDGHTHAEFFEALQGGPPPAWVREVGGPNTPMPGGTSEATLTLEPGNYVIVCFIPSPDGVMHVAKGMSHPFVVGGGDAAARPAAAPAPDVVATLTDYDFTFSDSLRAGRQVVRVRNDAAQPHEMFIVRLNEGVTPDQFASWVETQDGPPPAEPIGGTTAIANGLSNDLELDLAPGEYLLICFVPDASDGRPHLAHG